MMHRMKNMLYNIQHISIRTKLLLSFSLVIIALISSTLLFALSKYNAKLLNNNIDYSKKVTSSLMENADEYLSQLKNISNVIAYNHHVQKYLNQHDSYYPMDSSDSFQRTLELLSNILTSRSDIDSILIFDNSRLSVFKSMHLDLNTAYDYKSQPWYKDISQSGVTPQISGPHQQDYLEDLGPSVFSVNRTIQRYDGLKETGVMHISVNTSEIKKFCDSANFYKNGLIFIVNQTGEIMYHPDDADDLSDDYPFKSHMDDLTTRLIHQDHNIFTTYIHEEKYQIVSKSMSNAPWYIVAATPYKSITEDAEQIKKIILSMGVLALIFALAITYVLSTAITNPILRLRKCMAQVQQGNLTIRADIRSHDEIGILSSRFNSMLEQIEKLMAQVISDQEQKRKLELKTLQAQINPHFLYNTLDSIIWMAESKNDNIVPMTESLSKLFRLSLSRGQDVIPLSSELQHIKHYLFIQSMRYEDKFTYTITTQDHIGAYKIIKLILQPLVENAIYHGIKNKREKGCIHIDAYTEGDEVIISITDDGIGMDAKTCEAILSHAYETNQRSSSGIGVHNVNERIKLYFGCGFGLQYKSTLGVGTTVYIHLPIITS